jgi:hypothetical protein
VNFLIFSGEGSILQWEVPRADILSRALANNVSRARVGRPFLPADFALLHFIKPHQNTFNSPISNPDQMRLQPFFSI